MVVPSELPREARGDVGGRARLAGRRILVVGAGTRPCDDPDPPVGNGRAVAVLAAREGAHVACADINRAAAQDTADWIVREGHRAAVIEADVATPAACGAVVDSTIAQLGGIDGVVLNVGIGVGDRLEGTTAEMWDVTFGVNLRAHFLVARAAM